MGLHKNFHEAGNKRIPIGDRIATYNGKGALTLSYGLSKDCGHYNVEGDFNQETHKHWSRVFNAAMELAEKVGGDIEIYASHPKWGYWQIGTAWDQGVF